MFRSSSKLPAATGWELLFKPTSRDVAQSDLNRVQRRLGDAANDDLRQIILELFPRDKAWEIACAHDDPEALAYARELRSFLDEQGFDLRSRSIIRSIFEEPIKDLHVERKTDRYRLIVGNAPAGSVKQHQAKDRRWPGLRLGFTRWTPAG